MQSTEYISRRATQADLHPGCEQIPVRHDSGMITATRSPQVSLILMAGLDHNTPAPTGITLHRKSRVLEIAFSDDSRFSLPFEYLRVYSPSAEVRGHGPGQETLQQGKRDVDIVEVEPVGNYAIKPVFSDGHDTGLYSWDYLYLLGQEQDARWQEYLDRLERDGGTRDPSRVPPPASKGGGCGKH
jgi:DUF971 family protein